MLLFYVFLISSLSALATSKPSFKLYDVEETIFKSKKGGSFGVQLSKMAPKENKQTTILVITVLDKEADKVPLQRVSDFNTLFGYILFIIRDILR